MATMDLIGLIFEEILKVDPSIISKYPTVQDQLINLLLIPHIILILFLFGFGNILAREHKGLRYLVSIGAYIFIVYSGWYGALAQLATTWFVIMIVFGLVLFFASKIMPPIVAGKFGSVGKKMGEKAFSFVGKGKAREELESERKYLKNQIAKLGKNPRGTSMILKMQYEDRLNAIEKEIRKMGG